MLSRVILQGFGTVNSPLCTDAPPKAKEKHKACNFQNRLSRKPPELRRISSASKCRSSPSFGQIMWTECRKSSRLLRRLEAGNCTGFWLSVYRFLTCPSLASRRDRSLQITNNVRVQLTYQITDVTRPQTYRVVYLWTMFLLDWSNFVAYANLTRSPNVNKFE